MKYLYAISILIVFVQCTPVKNTPKINGYWMQEGYGIYMEITDSLYKMYDVTAISCQPSASGSIDKWADSLDILMDLYAVEEMSAESMTLKYGITSYKFNRLKEPLQICNSPVFTSGDPRLNFDIFWHTFKENYAYSELRGVDWDNIYEVHKNLISEHTTAVELFGYIAEILDAIKDEHISLRVPDSISNAYLAVRARAAGAENPPPAGEETAFTEKEVEYSDPRPRAMMKVEKLFPETKFKSYHKDLVRWGKLNKTIGYVQINGMSGYTEDVLISDSLSHKEYWDRHWGSIFKAIGNGKTLGQYLRGEVSGANTVMETILADLSGTSGMIIDLRFNPGGTDQVALEILSYFAKESSKAFTKKIHTQNQSTFESEVYIPVAQKKYNGNLVILTGPQTGSSAETFVLASLQIPGITRVGSNTMGIFSDALQKKLPNGWSYGLSNEIYETENSKNFEYTGIPPEHEIQYSGNWYAFHTGIIALKETDPAIEQAIMLLQK